MKNYGVDFPFLSKEIQEKSKNTLMKNYGVDCYFKLSEIREKIKETCLKNYGVKNPNQKHLQPIIHLLNDIEWWEQFNSINEIKCFLDSYLSESVIYTYINKFRPELIGLNSISNPHQKIINLLKEHNIEHEINTRKIISPFELDIYIPFHNLAIEINGLFWHSELNGKDSNYHLNKTLQCNEKGIDLIQFWDIEINNKWELISSMILSRLNLSKKIPARKCFVNEVPRDQERYFLNENHIQGYIPSSFSLGLYHCNELVSLMTFSKPRYNKKYDLELLRFCSLKGLNIIGGASRLFNHHPKGSIISYSNHRIFNGKMYEKLGFQKIEETSPSYYYTNDYETLSHRSTFQKHKLHSLLETFDPSITEWDNMQLNGFDRIWDCGTVSWDIK